jgi:hypothetical protein
MRSPLPCRSDRNDADENNRHANQIERANFLTQ